MTKKTRPSSVSRPAPGEEPATLHLALHRAGYLRQLKRRVATESKQRNDDLSLAGGFGVPYWTLATLYLACLHTVIEGWRSVGASDPSVDSLLGDSARCDRLAHLRNGVFHFGAIDSADVLDVIGDRDMLRWADRLYTALAVALSAVPPETAT